MDSTSIDEGKLNQLTEKIIGTANEVHRVLGPGLLESIYEAALGVEVHARDLTFERQKPLDVLYKGVSAGEYRVDLIVGDTVVVEVKAVRSLERVHEAQLLPYLHLTRCPVGLLINFNVPRLMDGLKRMRL